jgi:hypothetical protein
VIVPAAADAQIKLTPIGRFNAGGFRRAEIAAYDPATKRVFSTNRAMSRIDVLDISDPALPVLSFSIPVVGKPNSVAAHSSPWLFHAWHRACCFTWANAHKGDAKMVRAMPMETEETLEITLNDLIVVLTDEATRFFYGENRADKVLASMIMQLLSSSGATSKASQLWH